MQVYFLIQISLKCVPGVQLAVSIGSSNGLVLTEQAKSHYLNQLEQLERLLSEDTPRRLMITHIIESYWIPSQKKTKSNLQI